jgi:hypothetical protein
MLIERIGNEFICSTYDWGKAEDFFCGTIRFGGPEDYWHFWPAYGCRQMTAGDLLSLSNKLKELNKQLRDSTG